MTSGYISIRSPGNYLRNYFLCYVNLIMVFFHFDAVMLHPTKLSDLIDDLKISKKRFGDLLASEEKI